MNEEEKALWGLVKEFDDLESSDTPDDVARKKEIAGIMKAYLESLEDDEARDEDQYNLIQTAAMIAETGDPKPRKMGEPYKVSDDEDFPF